MVETTIGISATKSKETIMILIIREIIAIKINFNHNSSPEVGAEITIITPTLVIIIVSIIIIIITKIATIKILKITTDSRFTLPLSEII